MNLDQDIDDLLTPRVVGGIRFPQTVEEAEKLEAGKGHRAMSDLIHMKRLWFEISQALRSACQSTPATIHENVLARIATIEALRERVRVRPEMKSFGYALDMVIRWADDASLDGESLAWCMARTTEHYGIEWRGPDTAQDVAETVLHLATIEAEHVDADAWVGGKSR